MRKEIRMPTSACFNLQLLNPCLWAGHSHCNPHGVDDDIKYLRADALGTTTTIACEFSFQASKQNPNVSSLFFHETTKLNPRGSSLISEPQN